jgi:tRNA-splicing ligase RtcB
MEQLSKRLMSWASILEDQTRQQAERTATLPFIFPHVALMPDAHLGKGSTVGCVIPTIEAIVPAAVGVDIGCGMIAVGTQFTAGDVAARRDLPTLRAAIERAIPLSAGVYNASTDRDRTQLRIAELEQIDGADSAEAIAGNWRLQLGSLGSGNHFVECSTDEHERVWLFLHSGSRGVGNKLANKHIKIAQKLCEKWWIQLPDRDLAYLPERTPEFWAYIRDLRWAQHFALLNREEMMDRVIDCLQDWIGQSVEESERVNCHHNYTTQEEHFGKSVWLSRKGAIDASAGRPGLIPGSMGTKSYVVTGKGCRLALNSAPHGAGRMFSRTAARKKFTRAELDAAMTGIEWRKTDAFLDEIPVPTRTWIR